MGNAQQAIKNVETMMSNLSPGGKAAGYPELQSLYDYVMVFKQKKVKGSNPVQYCQSTSAKFCINAMLQKGLKLFTYASVQDDELIVLIRCPDSILHKFADQTEFKMLVDPIQLRIRLEEGNPKHKINPIHIKHDPNITPLLPFEYIYLTYEEEQEHMYTRFMANNVNVGPWRQSVRLKLTYYLLKASERQGGCNLDISKFILMGKMLAFFPLHDATVSAEIFKKCQHRRTLPWHMPFDNLKEYFGEKYTLFIVFLSHYTHFLIVPSAIGLVFQLVVWGSQNYSSPVLPFYGVVISIWAIVMLEYWKRLEKRTALRWGMIGFEDTEPDRPEYQGTIMQSIITGEDMIYFPEKEFRERLMLSFSIIGSMILIVMGVVGSIYYMRFSLQPTIGSYASTLASVINAVQIQVFNAIYQGLARVLTEHENHRTDTQYQDSLISKLFMFQFVNSYASFFFLAFIAQNLPAAPGTDPAFVGQCGFSNCMQPLSINLAIIFGTRLIVTNIMDVAVSYFSFISKVTTETAGVENVKLTPPEKDYMFQPYDLMYDSIQNYADTVIQFGFMVLFATALPCACFFSMFNTYIKLKINTWKAFKVYQRPIPIGGEDIGAWQSIFNIMSVCAVLTNAGLICFTMDVLDTNGFSYAGKLWIFVGFQWVLMASQYLAAEIIPDCPREVEIQCERMEFFNEKIIEKIADDEEPDKGEAEDESTHGGDNDDEDDHKADKGCCCNPAAVVGGLSLKGAKKMAEFPTFVFPHEYNAENKPLGLTNEFLHGGQLTPVIEERAAYGEASSASLVEANASLGYTSNPMNVGTANSDF